MAEPIEIIIRQGGQNGAGFSGSSGSSGGGFGATRGASTVRGQATGLLSGSEQPGSGLLKQLTLGDAMLIDMAKSQIKSTIQFGITQYGNLTGDYIGQRNIRNTLTFAGEVAGIAMATYKYGIAGFVVSSFVTASNIGMQYWNYQTDIRKQNIQAEFMRERAGSTLGSGSRGTYE